MTWNHRVKKVRRASREYVWHLGRLLTFALVFVLVHAFVYRPFDFEKAFK